MTAFFDLFDYSGDSVNGTFTVPAGKRLVIEFVSVETVLPAGQKPGPVAVQTTVNGSEARHVLNAPVFSVTTTVGDDIWVASQHLTLYADAGTEIRVGQGRGTSSGNAFILASLSGHLIDCSVAPCQ